MFNFQLLLIATEISSFCAARFVRRDGVYDGSISAGVSGSRYGFGVLAEYVAREGDRLITFSWFGIGVDDYGD